MLRRCMSVARLLQRPTRPCCGYSPHYNTATSQHHGAGKGARRAPPPRPAVADAVAAAAGAAACPSSTKTSLDVTSSTRLSGTGKGRDNLRRSRATVAAQPTSGGPMLARGHDPGTAGEGWDKLPTQSYTSCRRLGYTSPPLDCACRFLVLTNKFHVHVQPLGGVTPVGATCSMAKTRVD
jgi:hypothetical protein